MVGIPLLFLTINLIASPPAPVQPVPVLATPDSKAQERSRDWSDRTSALIAGEAEFVRLVDRSANSFSGGAARLSLWYRAIDAGGTMVHNTLHLGLGSFNDALSGKWVSDLALGQVFLLRPTHGPLVRGGVRGDIFAANQLYYSQFELPYVEGGYALKTPTAYAEVGPHLGIVVDGRFNPGDDNFRRLNLVNYGFQARVHSTWLALDLFAGRLYPARHTERGPVDQLRGMLCVSHSLALCADGRLVRGAAIVPFEGTRLMTAAYVGFLVGFQVGPSSSPSP